MRRLKFFGLDEHVNQIRRHQQSDDKQSCIHNHIFSNQSIHLKNSAKQPKPLSRHTRNPIENKSIDYIIFLLGLYIKLTPLPTAIAVPPTAIGGRRPYLLLIINDIQIYTRANKTIKKPSKMKNDMLILKGFFHIFTYSLLCPPCRLWRAGEPYFLHCLADCRGRKVSLHLKLSAV